MKRVSLFFAMLCVLLAFSCKKDNSMVPAPVPGPTLPPESPQLDNPANCYIVSTPGDYSFKAVKGNSDESVGSVASVAVLWESFGTNVQPAVKSLIAKVGFTAGTPGIITFSTPAILKNGNALIVAKDASDHILWSWHIWLCGGYDAQVYAQTYYNGAGVMMDRNLGATSATPGDIEAYGLFYQWGRKDPFLGGCELNISTKEIERAASTFYWPDAVASDASHGTIDFAIQNPTTFIKATSDWLYTPKDNLWGSKKTIYDPCPPGWRVPDEEGKDEDKSIWLKAIGNKGMSITFDENHYGVNFTHKFGDAASIWYPASGYFTLSGLFDFFCEDAAWWSCSASGSHAACACIDDDMTEVYFSSSQRVFGQSVRCCKE